MLHDEMLQYEMKLMDVLETELQKLETETE